MRLASQKSKLHRYKTEPSAFNVFDPEATSSESCTQREVTVDDNVRIVDEIVDNIFEEKRGYADISSSHCASSEIHGDDNQYDRRLSYWKKVLEDRKLLECRVSHYTGKEQSEVLFNRPTTLDERDKSTVKRLMDYADRLNPNRLLNRKRAVLPEYCQIETCTHIKELEETLPKAERDQCKMVEISGLPSIIKVEMLGRRAEIDKTGSKWLRSKVLEKRVEEKRHDIERVIEYYPDIENLQIVGQGIFNRQSMYHNAEINLIAEEPMNKISSDTVITEDMEDEQAKQESVHDELPDYSIKINEHIFLLTSKRSSKTVEVETNFVCEPFEKVIKRTLRLENLGKKVVNFEFALRSFYEKNGRLLRAQDKEFLFNHSQFRLFAGEQRDIVVQFQPRKVGVVKEKWLLKLDPQFFCRKVDGVAIKLSGKCKAPPEYERKLNEVQRLVIEKSNMTMMRNLTGTLASITPMLKPDERNCPYQRTLDERELFELENPGYKVERFHDIELLKALYQRVKKPREHPWDFKLNTLKCMILRLDGADQRCLVMNELIGILDAMRGTPICLVEKIIDNPERDRTRFIYVRGIMCTAIDEWEELMHAVEEGFYKPALLAFHQKAEENAQLTEEEEEEEFGLVNFGRIIAAGEEAVQNYVLKKLRRGKVYRDSVYIQTYTHVCNIVEDIVSVIESTDLV